MATLILTLLGMLILFLFYQVRVLYKQVELHQETIAILIATLLELTERVEGSSE